MSGSKHSRDMDEQCVQWLNTRLSMRYYIAGASRSRVMASLEQTLEKIDTHGFQVERIEPR